MISVEDLGRGGTGSGGGGGAGSSRKSSNANSIISKSGGTPSKRRESAPHYSRRYDTGNFNPLVTCDALVTCDPLVTCEALSQDWWRIAVTLIFQIISKSVGACRTSMISVPH